MNTQMIGPLSAWIAAGISCLATLWTFYLCRRDRQEPAWLLQRIEVQVGPQLGASIAHEGAGKPVLAWASLTNIGDGAAHGILIQGAVCGVGHLLRIPPTVESMCCTVRCRAWFPARRLV